MAKDTMHVINNEIVSVKLKRSDVVALLIACNGIIACNGESSSRYARIYESLHEQLGIHDLKAIEKGWGER